MFKNLNLPIKANTDIIVSATKELLGFSEPIGAVVVTGITVAGAGVVALVVFAFVKGGPVLASKASALVSPTQPPQLVTWVT